MKNLTRITKTSAGTTQKSNSVKNNKTSVSSKSNAAKTNTQAKSTPTKNNDTVTNKSVTASSKSKILESIQKQYEHTTDSKQKEAMKKTMNDIASGVSSKSDSVEKKLEELGIDLSALHTSTTDTGTVFELTKPKTYTVVSSNDTLTMNEQELTENDFQRIVNIMTHEAGYSANANSEMFGIASVVLNEYEHVGFYDYGIYSKNTFSEFLNGFYKANSNLSTGGLNIASGISYTDAEWRQAEEILKFVLDGNRAFGSETCYWVGNSSGKYAGRVTGFSTCEKGTVDTTGGVKGIDY